MRFSRKRVFNKKRLSKRKRLSNKRKKSLYRRRIRGGVNGTPKVTPVESHNCTYSEVGSSTYKNDKGRKFHCEPKKKTKTNNPNPNPNKGTGTGTWKVKEDFVYVEPSF